jgi:flagellar hook-basal body complex protein FliE
MLQAMDKVSGDQQFASQLVQQSITDPDSVDTHDITIAQAKASMSLNIARNVLSRLVQDWRDLINTR